MIIYKTLPHYRATFYELLRQQLSSSGIHLDLIVGQPDADQALRMDTSDLAWAQRLNNRHLRFRGRTLVWQPVLRRVRGADLVIVEQASRLLVNYLLIAWRKVGGPRLAFWGHGINLDPVDSSRLGEALKHRTIRACDWWFAYTDSTASILTQRGIDGKRMTVVQNAIDTTRLRDLRESIGTNRKLDIRRSLGMEPTDRAGIFVGSLYKAKRLSFLIECCDLVRKSCPRFHLIIVGDGPDRSALEVAASSRPWVHIVGQKRDEELVEVSSACDVLLMPGAVGLAILDAFALGLPMITTASLFHGPEVSYLVDGVNGMMVGDADNPAAYAEAVLELLNNEDHLVAMRDRCIKSSSEFTVEEMASRFAAGIRLAIE